MEATIMRVRARPQPPRLGRRPGWRPAARPSCQPHGEQRGGEQGMASIIATIILMPLLFLFVMLGVQAAVAARTNQVAAHAAQEGDRAARIRNGSIEAGRAEAWRILRVLSPGV